LILFVFLVEILIDLHILGGDALPPTAPSACGDEVNLDVTRTELVLQVLVEVGAVVREDDSAFVVVREDMLGDLVEVGSAPSRGAPESPGCVRSQRWKTDTPWRPVP
jgi:hypothetical protein